MKVQIEQKIQAGFAVALACLLLTGAVTWWSARQNVETFRAVDHTHEVLNTLDGLLVDMLNAETGMRGFIISGKDAFLEPYQAGIAAVQKALAEARRLTQDNPHQQRRLAALEPLIQKEVAIQARLIQLRRSGDFGGAQRIVTSGEGKETMDEIRKLMAELKGEEYQLLQARSAKAQLLARTTIAIVIFGSLLAIILVGIASFLVRRDFAGRQLAENALRRSEESLAVTLHSIGDAVLATDVNGKITRMNRIAEQFTGWAQTEALGRPVGEVFRIINEDTRQPATIPVDEVLATGQIHGLANHTVLIARNGTEISIADSAAPIRGTDAGVTGVVLVFRDVSKERAAEIALQRQNVQLEEANKELESFSYSVSHDLRAPLRHIHGFVEMLMPEAQGKLSEKGQRYLKIIADASEEMGVLIDDLLSFSRMARTEMNETTVNLDMMVQDSVHKLASATKDRAINWKIAPLPAAVGDPSMLRQVFANLLGNAVKYTRRCDLAEIEIGCAGKEGDRLIFFVRDNGVGFDQQYAYKLFGAFQRLHRADEFEGTGIGLAIVRRIITRHDGRTWAEGKANQGATFYFTVKPAPNP